MTETSPHRTEPRKVVTITNKQQMDFGSAIRRVAKGRHVKRLNWDDKIKIALIDERLMVFSTYDDQWHPLIVHAGDLHGKDWVVVNK